MERTSGEVAPWAAALGGDGEAFGEVFDLYWDRVYRHALRLVGNVHDAEDVTADAFFELWRRRRSVRLVEGSVLPWLLVTTTNLSRNRVRSLRRYRAFLASLPRSGPALDDGEAAASHIDETGTAERVREALGSLPASVSTLIILTAFEGLSPAQAATALGISDGAARVRLCRARAKLASVLGMLSSK